MNDPAWWAELASQLPAAWGNGAIDSDRVEGLEAKLTPQTEVPQVSQVPGRSLSDPKKCEASEEENYVNINQR
ncbi:unnamed protein product [Effrenium voratum]|uniref:Uncharacterized protein n=1 Tax=Effrenium voratum TaxID=2562239 RepID=A0AA36JKR2_9DINO|nr:unnamed protein product [Effrenium voratum]CAJ1448393.1 unnamed protein product [Effrenium voratum]